MPYAEASSHQTYRITTSCPGSLTQSGRKLFWGLVIVGMVLLGALALTIGAWPILPFFGLELLLLYAAFRSVDRHAGDFERLTLQGGRLFIERSDAGRLSTDEMNRYWTRVILRCGQGGHRCRLSLRCHGREIEFGRLLSDEERAVVAGRLDRHIGFSTRGSSEVE